ncbi:NAD-dependent epimerase/dehydratase family protein [Algoriphagus sp.]|uniref:NAD-dependent epimerase/dehydratase family protein n=1 Tax=Algoriphagus sp. TaxID=1872435 RepID=UPI00326C0DFC
MNYLLTGASGFLGKYLLESLKARGSVLTIGRSAGNDIQADFQQNLPSIPEVDMVVHAAGSAHFLPTTQEEINKFFDVNVQGTKRLLDRLAENKNLPSVLVFISSVAVYGQETGRWISENSPTEGKTPYAVSKLQAEQLIDEWGKQHGVKVFILRLPLIVGDHAPGNLGAMQQAIRKGYYFRIGKGESRKSMVLAEDIANLIPHLPTFEAGIFNLTDRVDPKLSELDIALSKKYGKSVKVIPLSLVKILARIGDRVKFFPINSYRLEKLTGELTFDTTKAVEHLRWNPRSVLTWLSI